MICQHCGAERAHMHDIALYCSDRCRAAAWKRQTGVDISEDEVREWAEEFRCPALSERQRAKLEARETGQREASVNEREEG